MTMERTQSQAEAPTEARPVIDVMDALTQRVSDGHPIYVVGEQVGSFMDIVTRIAVQGADESGNAAKRIQLVDLSTEGGKTERMNPMASFAVEPDTCMQLLMRGAGVTYLSTDRYEQAKAKGVALAAQGPVNLKLLVDVWSSETELGEFADAVSRAFIPK